MSKIYSRLFYHVIWRTYLSQPDITGEIETVLYPFLMNKAKKFHCILFEANGIEEHTHVAISIPPSVSVSDIVGKLKGSSSYFLNKELGITQNFSWQDGFGVFSVSENDLPRIIRYIQRQKEHHRSRNLIAELEHSEDVEERGSALP